DAEYEFVVGGAVRPHLAARDALADGILSGKGARRERRVDDHALLPAEPIAVVEPAALQNRNPHRVEEIGSDDAKDADNQLVECEGLAVGQQAIGAAAAA